MCAATVPRSPFAVRRSPLVDNESVKNGSQCCARAQRTVAARCVVVVPAATLASRSSDVYVCMCGEYMCSAVKLVEIGLSVCVCLCDVYRFSLLGHVIRAKRNRYAVQTGGNDSGQICTARYGPLQTRMHTPSKCAECEMTRRVCVCLFGWHCFHTQTHPQSILIPRRTHPCP